MSREVGGLSAPSMAKKGQLMDSNSSAGSSSSNELIQVKGLNRELIETTDESYKADKLIEQFTKKVMGQPGVLASLQWLRSEAHNLGHTGTMEDMREAISANYFMLGFSISSLLSRVRILEAMNKTKNTI